MNADGRYEERKIMFLHKCIGNKYQEIAIILLIFFLHKMNSIFGKTIEELLGKSTVSFDFRAGEGSFQVNINSTYLKYANK